MTKIAIIYHSGRGHTKRLATAVLNGCLSINGIEAKLIDVEHVKENMDFISESAALIFGSPTYMGSVSAPFKQFMDDTSKIWLKQEWSNKLAAGFVNSGWPSGDKFNTMLQLTVFAAQHGMIWVNPAIIPGNLSKDPSKKEINRLGSFLGVMSMSEFSASCEKEPPECDMQTAELLGKRVAKAATIWSNGLNNTKIQENDTMETNSQSDTTKEEGEKNMKKYVCTVCNYVYDPAVGDPDNGIAPGTAFEDIPEDWVCPLCGVGKDQFEVEE